MSLTNQHISQSLLPEADLDSCQCMKNGEYSIGESSVRKRKRAQEKYRVGRKQRIEVRFRGSVTCEELLDI